MVFHLPPYHTVRHLRSPTKHCCLSKHQGLNVVLMELSQQMTQNCKIFSCHQFVLLTLSLFQLKTHFYTLTVNQAWPDLTPVPAMVWGHMLHVLLLIVYLKSCIYVFVCKLILVKSNSPAFFLPGHRWGHLWPECPIIPQMGNKSNNKVVSVMLIIIQSLV